MEILVFDTYKTAWRKQNPHDRVSPPKAVKLPYGKLIAIMVGVIAVNILSMAHTAPVIAQTISTPHDIVKWLVGFCGVLGVEFTMFVFMYISMDSADKLGKAIRWFVILAAFLVAMIANVSSTVEAMTTSGDAVELIAAVILGAFAPAANLSAGEVLRRVVDKVAVDRETAQKEYHTSLIDEDKRLRNLYIRYLKSYGITDPTNIMRLSAGESLQNETSVGNNNAVGDVADSSGDSYSSAGSGNTGVGNNSGHINSSDNHTHERSIYLTGRALEIHDDIVANGLQSWTQQALVGHYKTSPNTIAKIRKVLKQ